MAKMDKNSLCQFWNDSNQNLEPARCSPKDAGASPIRARSSFSSRVLLTVWLRQLGSAESRPLDPAQEEEKIEPGPTPWPVRVGGAVRWLYARSLALVFMLLFLGSFALHARGSWMHENEERAVDGEPPVTLVEHMRGPQFWFESFQNWQSEFVAVLSIVVLSIWLRQDKSPESKPVAAPHRQTGA